MQGVEDLGLYEAHTAGVGIVLLSAWPVNEYLHVWWNWI